MSIVYSVEKELLNQDISAFGATYDVELPDDFSNYNIISVQLEISGLTGTLDGSVQLKQRNSKNTSFVIIPNTLDDLDTADDSIIIETAEFGGKNIAISFTKGNITGGNINIYLVAKRK